MGHAETLASEIANDPAGLYGGLSTDVQYFNRLTDATLRDDWQTLTAAQIFEAIDASEFTALSDAAKARVDRILGLAGEIATAPGGKARAEIIAVFGAPSTTVTNLVAIANPKQSRADELGIAGWITLGRVSAARGG